MTESLLKFRYASELAGVFVLVSVLLVVAAIPVCRHAQGWFERRFVLRAKFDTEEGPSDFRKATKCGSGIRRRARGQDHADSGWFHGNHIRSERPLQALLNKGFQSRRSKRVRRSGRFVCRDREGKGPPVVSGDFVVCKKDEEIMEIAKKALNDIQAVVLPLVDKPKQILTM